MSLVVFNKVMVNKKGLFGSFAVISKQSVRLLAGFLLCSSLGFASEEADSLGAMASTLTSQFDEIAGLMIAVAYVAGIGFGISAIFKFKQHKDNPTQVPVGTPFAMLAISVLLVFLPGIYAPAGTSIFGTSNVSGSTSGTASLPGGDITISGK